MARYKVFLHGVPVGHEMCGAATGDERSYLKLFYGTKSDAPIFMQTDIVNGTSYYSYIHCNNFSNVEGRPGSYLGITVSLGRNICKDVASLYSILEQTYNGICIGAVVKENATGGMFIVREIKAAKYSGYAVLDCVQNVIEKNIDKLIGGNFTPVAGNVNTHGTVRFHISEVNSPLFIEAMLSKTVLISSAFETAGNAYKTLADRYKLLETEYAKYKTEFTRQKERLVSFERSNADLQKEMAEATSRADMRYKKELDALKGELADIKQRLSQCESERDNLEKRLSQATNAIEKIDEPYRQLSHLMIGRRTQSTGREGSAQVSMYINKKQMKSEYKVRLSLVNLVLLLLVLIVVVILLIAVKSSHKAVADLENSVTSQIENYIAMGQNITPTANSVDMAGGMETSDNGDAEVDWKVYKIELGGYTGTFQKGKTYHLSLKKKDGSPVDDNVKGGTWEVSTGDPSIPGIQITDNCLYIGMMP